MYTLRNKYFGYLLAILLALVAYSEQAFHDGPDAAMDIFFLKLFPNKLCGSYGFYINETRKCYPPWSKGPCGELMTAKPTDLNLGLGQCECQPTYCGSRPIVHVPGKNRCYYLFHQGPCAEGKWLIASRKGVPRCKKILCPEKYNLYREEVNEYSKFVSTYTHTYEYPFPYKNKCYIARSLSESPCPQGKVAAFDHGNFRHVCSSAVWCGREGNLIAETGPCPSGGEPDKDGGCDSLTV